MARIKFEEMGRAEQRVVIAKDLLLRLRAKTFTPKSGSYLLARRRKANETDARKALRSAECKGCQIGGFFVCALDRHNQLDLLDVGLGRMPPSKWDSASESDMRSYLYQWFSHDELNVMEAYFEAWAEHCGERFGELIHRPADRMRMIAQNIIDGNGRFSATRLMKTARQKASSK